MSLVKPINEFNNDLLRVLRATNGHTEANLFYSPLGIFTSLTTLLIGSRNDTERQLKECLHCEEIGKSKSVDSLQKLLNNYIDNNNGKKEVDLILSCYLNAGEDVQLNQSYENMITSKLNVDLSNSSSNCVTQPSKDILERIKSLNEGVSILSVVYFKGLWEKKFLPSHTKQMPFYSNGKTPKTIDMMSTRGYFHVLRSTQYCVFSLNFKQDLAMIVLLPDTIDGLEVLLNKFKPNDLLDKMTRATHQRCDMFLPKFKIDQSIDLNSSLHKIGLKQLFKSETSNLTGLSNCDKTFVSKVFHCATMEIDEEGSRTATATTPLNRTVRNSDTSPPIRVDHPFMFIIVDNNLKLIMFTGIINNL